MNQKKLLLSLGLSVGLFSAAALLFEAPSANEQKIAEMSEEISYNANLNATTATTLPSRSLSSIQEILEESKSPVKINIYQVPAEQKASLKDYISIHRKVFTNEFEKKRAKDLMTNPNFIKGLERLLTAINPADREFQILQDAAIDLLLESEAKFQSEAAREALMNIVKDSQVENQNLAKADREQLAGVKAEVLYLWTAQNPAVAGDIQNQLPGIISQKIWANVKSTQDSNYQESLAEVRTNGN